MSQTAKLASLYILAVLTGVRNVYYWVPSDLDLLIPLAIAWIAFLWAQADARRRGWAFPLTGSTWIFCFATLAIPCYLIWSRGWRGLGWLVLNYVAMTLLSMAVMYAGGYLCFRDDWIAAIGGKG